MSWILEIEMPEEIHDEIYTTNYQNKSENISSLKGGKNTNLNFQYLEVSL